MFRARQRRSATYPRRRPATASSMWRTPPSPPAGSARRSSPVFSSSRPWGKGPYRRKNNTQMSSSLEIWDIFNGAHLAAFRRITKIYVKGERAPGEYWAASITMATPLHHNLKPYESTSRTGRTWFIPPLKLWSGWWGGRNSGLISRQFMSQLFNYLTSHSARTSILRMFSPWDNEAGRLYRNWPE